MKPRKVMIHLEMRSNNLVRFLRDKNVWQETIDSNVSRFSGTNTVHQVTVQVVKEEK